MILQSHLGRQLASDRKPCTDRVYRWKSKMKKSSPKWATPARWSCLDQLPPWAGHERFRYESRKMELANNSDHLGIIPVYFINDSYDDNSTFDEDLNRDPLYVVIPITFLYILIFLLGLTGNVSTCIVIARNRSMHTATNYYLFSLAVSDLLLLVSGLPPEMCFIWSRYPYPFGEVVCVLLRSVLIFTIMFL